MRLLRGTLAASIAAAALATVLAARAIACSPPYDPTIAALGPGQVVVVGTIGERVDGGRLFHVERTYTDVVRSTPIVIVFKEGEPVGDCSYPVSAGQRLIVAPSREGDGRLSADLSTLQADPDTDAGRAYVAEAEALFGPGIVPPAAPSEPDTVPADGGPPYGLTPVVIGLVAAIGVAVWWRREEA